MNLGGMSGLVALGQQAREKPVPEA
jgi:hypothetical protein